MPSSGNFRSITINSEKERFAQDELNRMASEAEAYLMHDQARRTYSAALNNFQSQVSTLSRKGIFHS